VRRPGQISIRAELGLALLGGAAAGVAGFAVFLVMHSIWIVPIWDSAPAVTFAVLAGIAIGWAYDVHRALLPARPVGRVAVVFASATLVLAPGLLLLPLRPPGAVGSPSIIEIGVGIAALLLLSMPFLAGAVGAVLGRSGRAALATGLAAFMFMATIGHNILLFGYGWHGVKMWTIMLTVTTVAAVTLVAVETWTSARLRPRATRQ
jgi:hypothetical protein